MFPIRMADWAIIIPDDSFSHITLLLVAEGSLGLFFLYPQVLVWLVEFLPDWLFFFSLDRVPSLVRHVPTSFLDSTVGPYILMLWYFHRGGTITHEFCTVYSCSTCWASCGLHVVLHQ